MERIAVVVLIVGAIVVVGVVAMYNPLVRRRLRTDETWARSPLPSSVVTTSCPTS